MIEPTEGVDATGPVTTGVVVPKPKATDGYSKAMDADPSLNDASVYLVWSNERRAWWSANRHGYTRSLKEAGRFNHREAILTCVKGIMGTANRLGMLPDMPVRAADLRLIAELFDPDNAIPQPWK